MPETVYSCDVAITVTLPSRYRKVSAEAQLLLTKKLILKALKTHKLTLICELTSNYDLHYHGILSVEYQKGNVNFNVFKYIKDLLRPDFGFTCVKQVEDYEGWCKYLSKDVVETNKYVYPIIQDDYKLFETGFHLPIE